MKCANCNCEIGNLTQCPYCGHKNRYIYRAQETGQYGTVGRSTPTRPVQLPHPAPQQRPAPQRNTHMANGYGQRAPTRTAAPPPKSRPRRIPREIANMELLLRLILFMQCVIAVLLTLQLIISSLSL